MRASITTNTLRKLRGAMRNIKYLSAPLHAYIIPNSDAHSSEYLANADKRLEYVSGFSGSSGTAIVTEDEALLWTDGRYHIQASEELDENWKLMRMGIAETPTEAAWLSANLEKGSRIGVDPKNVPYTIWNNLKKELEPNGHIMVPVTTNLIDLIWEERELPPEGDITPQPIEFSGKLAKFKIEEVRQKMTEKGAAMLIVSALDEIAWLLNLRGNDIPYNPVFFSFVILTLKHIHLFIDEKKITLAVRNHFNREDLPISLHTYDSFYTYIASQLPMIDASKKIWIGSSTSYEVFSIIPEGQRLCECSPVAVMKAVKNSVEAAGLINAHIKDAVALCRYFAWLEKEIPHGKITEMSGAEQLDVFRRDGEHFVGPSFPTISSSGPHAAQAHYIPTEETDRPLTCEELYLCDSGGQYRDGTTDVTRTIHFGTPSEFEKQCFTRVFQGQTALGTVVFPCKVKGNSLDVIARRALWNYGLDYLHSTGHGIGSYLLVHEGPLGIGSKPYPDDPGLQPNMFLSNEPGFYQEGHFGIRLENIVQVVPARTINNFQDKGFLTFNTITLVPIQTKLLIPKSLHREEIQYLNEYHLRCRETIGPILKKEGFLEAYEWLIRETEPIG